MIVFSFLLQNTAISIFSPVLSLSLTDHPGTPSSGSHSGVVGGTWFLSRLPLGRSWGTPWRSRQLTSGLTSNDRLTPDSHSRLRSGRSPSHRSPECRSLEPERTHTINMQTPQRTAPGDSNREPSSCEATAVTMETRLLKQYNFRVSGNVGNDVRRAAHFCWCSWFRL